ncbi:hypothetical protein M404DRAFT_996709 [Pisolithus tinctorius Marx 270]|uniref:Uncharacterized protein n=1 Tax=Pisolithus tinctorius Marx 270 TaxID=870435 RepID=A0A0C3P6N7_PISTI|nr:hypothetical protein M404DRAFT_996709 [Pisolithus tinctorius Marx 270]
MAWDMWHADTLMDAFGGAIAEDSGSDSCTKSLSLMIIIMKLGRRNRTYPKCNTLAHDHSLDRLNS